MAAPFVHDDVLTYTGDATPLAHTRSYEWCRPLCDIIGSLLNAGLPASGFSTRARGIAVALFSDDGQS